MMSATFSAAACSEEAYSPAADSEEAVAEQVESSAVDSGRPGLTRRRSILRWTIPRRSRLHRLNRWPTSIRRRTIPRLIDRPVIPGPCPWMRINRPANRCRRPVIRWPVAPVAPISRAVVIQHRARPIPGIGRTISAMPTAPRTTVVIDPARSPIPSPATPSPGLADQQRGNADANPEGDQPAFRPLPHTPRWGYIAARTPPADSPVGSRRWAGRRSAAPRPVVAESRSAPDP